ncbi:MAG: efflux RND transporter periplasmic adaptor subunit [Chloroflexi bacterium OHK40]
MRESVLPDALGQRDHRATYRRGPQVALSVVLALALGAGALAYVQFSSRAAIAPAPATEPVRWGNLTVTVTSSGSVQPARRRDLAFGSGGSVAELLVGPGERVEAGAPLARLDTTVLRRAVARAEVDLARAEAALAAVRDGESRPAELAEAEAAVAAAQAQLQQARAGTAKPAEILGAEADLQAARARLDALLSPPVGDLAAAEADVTRAREQLEATRAERSAAKLAAEADVAQAANAVRAAQQAVSDQYWRWQQAGAYSPRFDELKRDYDQAVREEQDAQSRLQQARAAYESAVAREIADLRRAEADLAEAEARLAALRTPDTREVAEARARVDRANADLARLRQGGTPAEIAAAEAALAQAQARRDSLRAPAAPSTVAAAEAELAQARLNLEAARADLDGAVLRAPFAGIIAEVTVDEGDQVNAGAPILTVIDGRALEVTIELSEYDVQQVAVGQPAEVSFEALPGRVFAGEVATVAQVGEQNGNLTTYAVTVRFDPEDAALKIGMTGDVAITVATRENAIQVPNRALQGEGEIHRLRVRRQGAQEAEQVLVRTGLSDGVMTEVLGCLPAGEQCLTEGDEVELALSVDPGSAGSSESVLIVAPEGAAPPSGAPVIRPIRVP